MKSTIKIFYISLFIFLFSCNNENGNIKDINHEEGTNESTLEWYNKERIKHKKIAMEAVISGDTDLYHKSSTWYITSDIPESFIFYSKAMAIKHNYGKAYYDIYVIYTFFYDIIDERDTDFINYLLFNLAKSQELGFKLPNELEIANKTIKKEDIKSSDYYLKKAFPVSISQRF